MKRQRIRPAIIALSTVLAILGGSLLTAGTVVDDQKATTVAQAHFNQAVADKRDEQIAAEKLIADAHTNLTAAQAALSSSDGKTLDSTARDALSAKIDRGVADLAHADDEMLVWKTARQHALTQMDGSAWYFDSRVVVLNALPPLATYFDATTEIADVNKAVDAWTTEQAHLAEEARVATESAANAASASSDDESGSGVYTQYVWTSGYQAELDACNGAVDLSARYHVDVVAEHSDCGGRSFPQDAGAVVEMTGVRSGTYRVIGVVAHLSASTNSSADIPRGYDLTFQTCAHGSEDMVFIALERIG